MINNLLRGVCLAVYGLALVGLAVELPFGLLPAAQYAALGLLAAHLLEVAVAYRSVRRYRGPLAVSVALTLLFGFLHWLPLAREGARAVR